MAALLGQMLLEAAIGVALSSAVGYSDTSNILTKVKKISEVVTEIKDQLNRIEDKIDDEDQEVVRCREIQDRARILFDGSWDNSILEFASELVLAVLDSKLMGIKLTIKSNVVDLSDLNGFRSRSFSVVIQAVNTMVDNLQALKSFFHELMLFNSTSGIPIGEPLHMYLQIARGYCHNHKEYDRLKARLCVRFAMLNTLALNWGHESLGNLVVNGDRLSNKDTITHKELKDNDEISTDEVTKITRFVVSGSCDQVVGKILQATIKSQVTTVKVIILSDGDWSEFPHIHTIDYHTANIRTFIDKTGLKYLELRTRALGPWEKINIDQVLLHSLSVSVLVFRFGSEDGLSKVIEKSKHVTDKFPGLTKDRNRILYIHTACVDQVKDTRDNIRKIACERRLLEPRDDEDIAFERGLVSHMMKVVHRKAQQLCILNKEFLGASRMHLLNAIRVLNGEVEIQEMQDESRRFLSFLRSLKAPLTKITIEKEKNNQPNLIFISKGDDLSPFGQTNKNSMYIDADKYHSFEDVPQRTSTMISVRIHLKNVPERLHETKLFRSNWKVIDQLEEMVNNGKLFFTPACEKLAQRMHRNQNCIIQLEITALGGGSMEDFSHAKLVFSALETLKADNAENLQMATRAVIRIAPRMKNLQTCHAKRLMIN